MTRSMAITVPLLSLCFAIGMTIWSTSPAWAQATTVQLPTFHSFSVGTSVLVPDRGGMVLGGVDRAASGSVTQGLPGLSHVPGARRLFTNRSTGREMGRSSASVSVWVHDLAAMDEALLAEAAHGHVADEVGADRLGRGRDGIGEPRGEGAQPGVARERTRSTAEQPAESLAAIRARQEREEFELDEQNRTLIAQGDAARAAGKMGVARLYYQMALRRAPTRAKSPIRARLAALDSHTDTDRTTADRTVADTAAARPWAESEARSLGVGP